MSGIWTSPNNFLDFDESPGREDLTRELYTQARATGFDPAQWLGYLPDPDPVLAKTGDGVEVLRSLTSDPKVLSSIQLRKVGTLKKKDYVIEPGRIGEGEPSSPATRLAEDLRRDLDRLDLYNLWSQILDAPYYGMAVVEIVWESGNGRLRIANLRPRPQEWFGWDSDDRLVFKELSGILADPVNPAKAVAVRHFPSADNPYGLRLLSRCLWPVAVKKGGIRFWTNLCERFGLPWVIGKARSGAQKKERQDMLDALSSMVQDAVAVISGGSEVDVHSVTGKAGDLHPALVRYMDSAIAMVLMGQTLTADIGNTGSKAASQTHYDVLADFQEADETLIATFMEDLGWIYGQVNAPDIPSPTFGFREPEDFHAQADLDKKLKETGALFRKVHYVRRYNLSEDEFDVPGTETESTETGGGRQEAGDGKGGVDHAQGDGGYTSEQQALEDLADQGRDQAVTIFERQVMERIRTIVQESESFDDVQTRLSAELGKGMAGVDLEDLLQQALVAADLWGRFQVAEEVKGDG